MIETERVAPVVQSEPSSGLVQCPRAGARAQSLSWHRQFFVQSYQILLKLEINQICNEMKCKMAENKCQLDQYVDNYLVKTLIGFISNKKYQKFKNLHVVGCCKNLKVSKFKLN